jgi:hypothetical protein
MPFYYDITNSQAVSTVVVATDTCFGRVNPTAGMETLGISGLYASFTGSTGGLNSGLFKVKSDSTAAQVNTPVATFTPTSRDGDRGPTALSSWAFSTASSLASSTFSTGTAAITRLILGIPVGGPAATWLAIEHDAKFQMRGSTTVSPFSYQFSAQVPSTVVALQFSVEFSEGA